MENENIERWSSVKRFFQMLKLDKKDISYVYAYAIFSGLITLSLPLGIQAIIGLIVGGNISTSLLILVGVVTVGTALTGILKIMQITVTESIQRKIFARSAFEFAYRLPRFRLERILRDYPPELVNRFFDTLTLQKGVPKLLIDFSTAILEIVFGLLLLSFYHPFFVFFGLILMIILVAIIRITGPGGLKTSLKESKFKYKVAYWLEEMARALTTFKMAGNNKFAMNQTDVLVANYLDNRKKHFRILLIQYGNIVGFKVVITLGLLLLGSSLVVQNQINIGQFVAAEIVVLLILGSVEKLIISMETVYDCLTAVNKIGSVVDLPMDEEGGLDYENIFTDQDTASIQLDGLTFQYSDSQRPTIKNMNLSVQNQERLCISGYNGSGKSTLVQLISGLYRDYSGQIIHKGVPLRNLCRDNLNRNVGQYSELSDIFRGSILENILLGHEELSLNDVIWVAEKMKLQKYVQNLPDGYETMLLPNGQNVPRSIRTKILLCRTIISKPQLLIFEE
ncbi:MAG: ABC transporter ATP-binding protein, partial [Bacteroidota bacterium]